MATGAQEYQTDVRSWIDIGKGMHVFERYDQNTVYLSIDKKQFKVTIPERYPDNSEGYIKFEAITNIPILTATVDIQNMKCSVSRKKPKLFDVLKKFSARYNKLINSATTSIKSQPFINDFDIEMEGLQVRILRNLDKMHSSLQLPNNQTPKLFTKKGVAETAIQAYIHAVRHFKSSSKISIELVNDNIFHWRAYMRNFSNVDLNEDIKKLRKEQQYDNIVVDIHLHDTFYPSYPPVIRCMKPKLNISYKLSQINMVKIDYWTPATRPTDVIIKLHDIINEHARIVFGPVKAHEFNELEIQLMKLSSLHDMDKDEENLDKDKYTPIYRRSTKTTHTSVKPSSSAAPYFAKGTGYSMGGTQTGWRLDEYEKLHAEKALQTEVILKGINTEIQKLIAQKRIDEFVQIIKDSQFIEFLISTLDSASVLDMRNRTSMYRILFAIIQELCTDNCISLFTKKYQNKTLMDALHDINTQANISTTATKDMEMGDDITSIIIAVNDLASGLKDVYEQELKHIEEQKIAEADEIKEKVSAEKVQHDFYVNGIQSMKVDTCKISTNAKYSYRTSISELASSAISRVSSEIATIYKSAPVHWDSSVLLRYDEDNIAAMRVMITGPKDTPYWNGIFIFDMVIPSNYPNKNPNMLHVNNGGQRFNPNLYACGKVCLSLLGTWRSDDPAEEWNAMTSTLLQLFNSIQSLILVEDPCFNEPGHQRNIGTPQGNAETNGYNHNIRYYTMCHSMLGTLNQIDTIYPEFKEAILFHFKTKRDEIIKQIDTWCNEGTIYTGKTGDHSTGPVSHDKYEDIRGKLNEKLLSL